MNTILSNKVWCFSIAVFLLAVQFILLKDDILFTYGPDAYSYVEAANDFWIHNRPYSTRPLGMSLFVVIPLLFSGETNDIILIFSLVNIAFWFGAAQLLYHIVLTRVGSKKWAGLCVLLFALHISVFIQVFLVLSEMIFIFFLLLFVRYLQLYFSEKTGKYVNLALATIIFMVLIKPVAIYLTCIMFVFWILNIKQVFTRDLSLLAVGLSIVGILVQLTMMKRTFGEFKISYVDNITWYYYLGAQSEALRTGRSYTEVREKRYEGLDLLFWEKKVPEARADMKKQLKNNKRNVLKAYSSNLSSNFFAGNPILKKRIHDSTHPKNNVKWFYRFSKWQNIMYNSLLILFVIGVLFLAINKKIHLVRKIDMIVLILVCYVFATSGITFTQGDRLTLIAQPLLLILVLTCCILLQNKSNNKEHAI